MKVLFFLIVSISLSIMFSCTKEEIVKRTEAKYEEFDVEILGLTGEDDEDYPDYLLTKEQLRTKYKYHETRDKYRDITKDGKIVLRMSEEEWLSTGLPKSYYDGMIRSYNDVNRHTFAITDSAARNGRIEGMRKGFAIYSKGWRRRYDKVKHLIDLDLDLNY
jgi:hypothetical protein